MEEVVANIRSALISTKGSTTLQQLQRDYREIVGEIIPFTKFGHHSLESFLRSVPTLKVSELPNGLKVVDAVATDNVKHIVSLVNKQKTSKKKVRYVASRFRPVPRVPYVNKQPYVKSPKYVKSPGFYKPMKKEPVFSKPKPVGNKRRLSVFERLGPKPESSEDLSTFDEDDEFISQFQSNRKVTVVRKQSLPPNSNITNLNKTPSSSESENWDDASSVLKQEEEIITKEISRLSLLRERISKRIVSENERRLTLPAFSTNNGLPPDMVFNNNLPINNMNILSDFDRPRMRHEHSFNIPASVCGATRPRMPFIPPRHPGIFRPNVPRYTQNKIVHNIQPIREKEENPVVTIQTTVDHRVNTEEEEENIALKAKKDMRQTQFLEVPKEELSPTYKIDKIKRWSDIGFVNQNYELPKDPSIKEPSKPKIPKYSDIPELKSFFQVKISHVINPSNFFIQPAKSAHVLNSLMGKIQYKYSQPIHKDVGVILHGFYCLKHQDGFFYRVQVIKFTSPDHVHIIFVDFGNEEEVSSAELVHLEEEFHQVPFQAIKAKLIGIKPNKTMWSKRDSDVFKQMVQNKQFVSVVVNSENESELVLELKLFDTSGKDDINIGKYMVDYGVAQFDFDN